MSNVINKYPMSVKFEFSDMKTFLILINLS